MKKQVFQWSLFFSMIYLFMTSASSAELSNNLTAQDVGNCHATYFLAEGKVVIPCIGVIDATDQVQNYEAVLEKLTTDNNSLLFGLKEWSVHDSDATTEEALSCRATYFSEEGRLLMPCVDVVDSSGNVESHEVVMEQSSSTLVELPKWTVTSVGDGIEAEEPHVRSTRESSAVCTSGNVNVNSISTSCVNGSCSTSGVKITCNSNSCQWCNASNQCGKILYNGVTSITGGSISCTNGKCTYSVKNGGSSSSGNFSCKSDVKQATVSVIIKGNGRGKIISDPAGINCTNIPGYNSSCSATFNVDSQVTLKVTEIPNTQNGNHFVGWGSWNLIGWSGTCNDSSENSLSPICTFKVKSKNSVTATFTLERCFGGVGNGCSGTPLLGQGHTSTNEIAVSVGSIKHDICCYNHPLGYACKGLGTRTQDEKLFCGDRDWKKYDSNSEWNKASSNSLKGRVWRHEFGSYATGMGDPLDLPSRLKAPDGTKLDTTDATYCASGKFMETDAKVKSQGFGTCGYKCGDTVVQGANAPETRIIELGSNSGKFQFDYETYEISDKIIIKYDDYVYVPIPNGGGTYVKTTQTLLDTGCVGTNGLKSKTVTYSGSLGTRVRVEVTPNCSGTPQTGWKFKVNCPTFNLTPSLN